MWEGGATLMSCVAETMPPALTSGVTGSVDHGYGTGSSVSFRACIKMITFLNSRYSADGNTSTINAFQMQAGAEPGTDSWAASGLTALEYYGETRLAPKMCTPTYECWQEREDYPT